MATELEQTQFEEIADFPERISTVRSVEESVGKTGHGDDDDFRDAGRMEEIRASAGEVSPENEIEDDYQHTVTVNTNVEKNDFDLSSLAAEIDGITRLEKKQPARKPVPEVKPENLSPAVGDDGLKPTAHPAAEGIVIINEEDDVDLDYYSLEELEGKMEALQSADTESDRPAPGKRDKGGVRDQDSAELRATSSGQDTAPDSAKAADRSTREKLTADHDKPAPGEFRTPGDDRITLEVPRDLRERLPEDFDISELTSIDLKEAEKIANEDMILLSEDDLIEELEVFDLVPLEPAKEVSKKKAVDTSAKEAAGKSEKEKRPMGEEVPFVVAQDPVHKIDSSLIVLEIEPEIIETDSESPAGKAKPAVEEQYLELEEELFIPEHETTDEIRQKPDLAVNAEETRVSADLAEVSKSFPETDFMDLEPIEIEQIERSAGKVKSDAPIVEQGIVIIEDGAHVSPPESGSLEALEKLAETGIVSPAPRPEKKRTVTKELIPSFLESIGTEAMNVHIIDDSLVERKEQPASAMLDVDELDRITSEIATVMEGAVQFIFEASPSEDVQNIAPILKGATPAFEDLLADLESEYSFRDDEIELIDSVFVAEDYQQYIHDIDVKTAGKHETRISTAVELLGLDSDEIGTMDENLFAREYEGIDIEERLRTIRVGLDQPVEDLRLLKKCSYLVPRPESLSAEEQRSIEEDVTGSSAFIYEEDVEEIRFKLGQVLKKRKGEDKISDISSEVIIIENGTDIMRFIETIPPDKKEVLKNLLWYLDGLFEKLPEDIIRKFADSEYFDLYSKVLTDLGK
ncbi:MAG: hypothetical protein EPN93_01325 [Spirochaetes bacterium]|nr:MAG: hypothetical protein EPN93_01325 [Spirochaetota bacterium]